MDPWKGYSEFYHSLPRQQRVILKQIVEWMDVNNCHRYAILFKHMHDKDKEPLKLEFYRTEDSVDYFGKYSKWRYGDPHRNQKFEQASMARNMDKYVIEKVEVDKPMNVAMRIKELNEFLYVFQNDYYRLYLPYKVQVFGANGGVQNVTNRVFDVEQKQRLRNLKGQHIEFETKGRRLPAVLRELERKGRYFLVARAATRAAKAMQNERQRKQAMRANVGTEVVFRPSGLPGNSKFFKGGIEFQQSINRLHAKRKPNTPNATNTTKRQRTQ